jgi:hypothetical protein
VKTLTSLRYDFSLNLITRNSQQAKQAVVGWCRQHGLQNAKIREESEDSGWTSYTIFSSYFDMKNYVILNNGDTKRAFEDLLQTLKKVDDKIRIRTNWQSLERYIALEQEAKIWKTKVRQLEADMCAEEDKISKACVVYETQDFDSDDEVMNSGTHNEINKHFKQP